MIKIKFHTYKTQYQVKLLNTSIKSINNYSIIVLDAVTDLGGGMWGMHVANNKVGQFIIKYVQGSQLS